MKTLPNNFYTMPGTANMTVDRKDLKELLLATGGSVLARGSLWDIKTQHLGAGVYKVTLKKTDYSYND
jgi:hypothetical protein